MNGEHIKLDLGSGNPEEGEIQPAGYVLQDAVAHKNISLVCRIEDLDKHVKKGQCQKIRASHVIEHFPTNEIVPMLRVWHSLLEDNGELEIHTPNLRWHAALFLDDRDEEAINYMFGGQRDDLDFHKTGFTPRVLMIRLNEAGFKIVDCVAENSIHINAVKE